MIPSLRNDDKASACSFKHSELPDRIEPKNVPSNKPPFSIFKSHSVVHTLDLMLPEEVWLLIQKAFSDSLWGFTYSKVHLSLLQVLSGDFFNHYIKSGNIILVSEGRPHVDNRFSLMNGILQLELDKPTYERCGLLGKSIESMGRKHVKTRYVVEINLRLPNMVRGKKGFDRVIWACTHVLDTVVTWLFLDSDPKEAKSPINQYHPHHFQVEPTISELEGIAVPLLHEPAALMDAEYQEQLLEWIALALIASPRVELKDKTDPYLARYQLPDTWQGDDEVKKTEQKIVRLRWRGLITAKFVQNVFLLAKQQQGQNWIALSAQDFDGKAYAVISQGERDVISWECA